MRTGRLQAKLPGLSRPRHAAGGPNEHTAAGRLLPRTSQAVDGTGLPGVTLSEGTSDHKAEDGDGGTRLEESLEGGSKPGSGRGRPGSVGTSRPRVAPTPTAPFRDESYCRSPDSDQKHSLRRRHRRGENFPKPAL